MKKFLTLALALVMVLGIATSAFAAGWGDITPAKPVAGNVTLSLDALSVEKKSSTLWSGEGGYAILDQTYPVIEGTKIHAVATVSFPKVMEDDIVDALKGEQGKLQIRLSAKNATIYQVNDTKDLEVIYYNITIADDPANLAGKTLTYEIWATAESSQKDAVIGADLGIYNVWNGDTFSFVKNEKAYTVVSDGTEFQVSDGNSKNGFVTFITKGEDNKGKMDASKLIKVTTNDGDEYEVVKNIDNTLTFRNTATGESVSSGATYNTLKGIFEDVFATLGFGYEGVDYMTKGHFTKYFGTQAEVGKTLKYPAGAVHQVVPGTSNDTSSVTPPQTGDNASIAGFVMIAVALIAAGAVTLKKVRA